MTYCEGFIAGSKRPLLTPGNKPYSEPVPGFSHLTHPTEQI